MTRLLWIALLLCFQPAAQAGAPAPEHMIVSCKAAGEGWEGRLEISEMGRARLALRKAGYDGSCELNISGFSWAPKAVVPLVLFELDRGRCGFARPGGETELVDFFTLKMDIKNGARRAKLQWLRHSQPTDCAIERFERDAVRSAHQRWKLGTWPSGAVKSAADAP